MGGKPHAPVMDSRLRGNDELGYGRRTKNEACATAVNRTESAKSRSNIFQKIVEIKIIVYELESCLSNLVFAMRAVFDIALPVKRTLPRR